MNKCRNKKRVLHLRSSGGLLGAENVVLEIAKFSIQNGWESIVGAINDVNDPYPDFLKLADDYNIKNILFETNGKLDFRCIKKIKEIVNVWNIDVIHTHGYKENMYALAMKSGVPKIATNHLWKTSTLKSKVYCGIDAFIIRYFDEIVGVSNEIVNQMSNLYIKNISMISNGVDVSKFKRRIKSKTLLDDLGLTENDFLLGMISSLTYEKNHKIAIEALSEINNPNIKLLIVGDGYLKESLQDLVLFHGLADSVLFAGRQSDIVGFLSILDVFLLPSLSEGLPMALLEAMSCGKAVIASRVGEIVNVLRDGENGLLVDADDVEQLKKAIHLFVDNQPLIEKIGHTARETVVEKFSSRRMSHDYCTLYDSLF